MTRFNPIVMASILFAYALLGLDGRVWAQGCDPPGALCITQTPTGSTAWSATEVEPYGDPYVYDVTAHWVGFNTVGFTSVNIDRESGYEGASITIRKLTVIRPDEDDEWLSVSLGNSSVRLNAVQEVDADPWSSGEQEGYVRLFAFIHGSSGVNALGPVQGANLVEADVSAGNVGGPITCTMHPLAETPEEEGSVVCTIKLRGDGSLIGDVIMESWDGSVDENYPTDKLGYISLVRFLSGAIGASNNIVDIRADYAIEEIKARDIHANITGTNADPGDTDFDSYMELLGIVLADQTTSTNGVFSGEVRAEELGNIPVGERESDASSIIIEGEMMGRIFLQRMAANNYGITMSNSTPNLRGTVLLGCLNPAKGSSVWASDVEVRADGHGSQINLDIDDAGGYNPERPSSDLGGGAATMMPVRLHRYDCVPPFVSSGDTVADPGALEDTIQMRHVGPVTWNSGDGQPYKVERRKAGSSDSFVEQSCFTCTLDNYGTIVRVTSSSATIQRGYQYRITQRTRGGDGSNVLRCDVPHLAVADKPEVVDHAAYTFTVCDGFFDTCPGDADDTGLVDANDVDNVLANWGSTARMKYGDADRNGVVNSVDLEVAETYLAWEYCYTAPQGFANAADGFALMDLDSDPAAMSEPMTLTQAVQYMGYEDIADFAAGFDAMEAPARAAARGVLMALLSGG